ncbi:hypothetical protein Q31a_18160 [Aureliella helgolandensis]|uniref:Uncharacterized protein n=2 Tax=Aureliella helgolandensis TaxID=2527968 RepID=A0A518G4J4_9BACT|nr:hypothetical protein Q31a_18160 [Aureliella helgolandensis]
MTQLLEEDGEKNLSMGLGLDWIPSLFGTACEYCNPTRTQCRIRCHHNAIRDANPTFELNMKFDQQAMQ